jgi:hypothetical protein
LSQPFLHPDGLLGLACFVWHFLMTDGDVYYPRLYEIFENSESEGASGNPEDGDLAVQLRDDGSQLSISSGEN